MPAARPDLRRAMWALEHCAHEHGIEAGLIDLVKLLASLVNGCARCVDMHTKVARSLGETVVSASAVVRVFCQGDLIAELTPELWLIRHYVQLQTRNRQRTRRRARSPG